jgi:DNA replication protein DnaC
MFNKDVCPSCGSFNKSTNTIDDIVCDCEQQKKLMIMYDKANIPFEYWFKSMDDFVGDKKFISNIKEYCENLTNYHKNCVGMFLYGKNGRGKTFLATEIIKHALRNKLKAFFVSYAEITSLFTSGWKSDDAKRDFEKNIENTDFLSIDDIGKDYKTQSHLAESILDRTLRYRKYPVIITSNLNVEELRKLYGSSFGDSLASLIYGKTIHIHMTGRDFREDISSNLKDTGKTLKYRKIK